MKTRYVLALAAAAVCASRAPAAEAADPTTADCLKSNEASIALRAEHRLRQARAELLICSARTCPADVRGECARRVDAVNAAIPTIIFEAKDRSGADVANVTVTMDGEPLLDRLEGIAISLDPGEHKFTFRRGGEAPVDLTLVLREAEKDRRERVRFGPSDAPPALTRTRQGVSATSAEPASSSSSLRWIGAGVGGVGVAGIALGTIFGLSAGSAASRSRDACNTTTCPNRAEALREHDSAASAATVSTIGFVAGGAALVGGVILFLIGSRVKDRSVVGLVPSFDPQTRSIAATGVFR